MSTQLAVRQNRIFPVDAARGFAMLMVFVAHIKQHFEVSAPTLHWILLSTTRIATPTFLLLSGFVVRLLLTTGNGGKASLMLIDRGLFLLTVGHVLLGFDEFPQMSFAAWMFARTGPVEAIGFGLFIALLLRNTSASKCGIFGIGAFAIGWFLEITAIKRGIWVNTAAPSLFQLNTAVDAISASELINEIGIFLMGMALSAQLERELIARRYTVVGRQLLFCGVTAVVTALIGVLVWHFGKHVFLQLPTGPEIAGVIRRTLDPNVKSPPSPGYLLFYGGAGLIIVSAFFSTIEYRLVRTVASVLAVIGRASLMCFIVQDWLFFGLPYALNLDSIHSVTFWSTYLGACIAILFSLAHWWVQIRGNRYFTVGLKSLARRGKLPRWYYAKAPLLP